VLKYWGLRAEDINVIRLHLQNAVYLLVCISWRPTLQNYYHYKCASGRNLLGEILHNYTSDSILHSDKIGNILMCKWQKHRKKYCEEICTYTYDILHSDESGNILVCKWHNHTRKNTMKKYYIHTFQMIYYILMKSGIFYPL
jgi:hypothetical protein